MTVIVKPDVFIVSSLIYDQNRITKLPYATFDIHQQKLDTKFSKVS